MCFAIPYKILEKNKDNVIIEGDKKIRLGKELDAKKGDYVQVIGNVAVQVLPKSKGENIRKLIKKLS